MKQRILQIITSIMLIITLTMANFVLLCANAVTYAADSINANKGTNHKNIQFMAYFYDGDNTKESQDVYANSGDLKIYFQVSVKQEGYFNGNIVLNDANFKLKTDILSDGIDKIENNTINLKQINAGETREYEIGIELVKDNQYDLTNINKESSISLQGTYKDSTQKNISINAERKVRLNLVNPYKDEDVILSQEIITNKVMKYNGEEKRIVQVEVNSGLTDNLFPIKNTEIEVQAPKTENVLVNSNDILATNGNTISQDNWNFNQKNGLININISNDAQENKVSWIKEGTDKIIITYVYDKTAEINSENIIINSKIKTYDGKEFTQNVETEINDEEKDSIVKTNILQNETNIYKGKLYAGISRDITNKNIIDINLNNVADEIVVKEENETDLNLVYSSTKLNKSNIENILGEGNIYIIEGTTGNVINIINKETEADENGNIVISYPEEVRQVIFKISADNIGRLEIENTKTIKFTEESIVRDAEKINTISSVKYTSNNNENELEGAEAAIALNEPETKVDLQTNRTELSTMTENNNVEFRVILGSKEEKNMLFKNPTLSLEIPEKIQNIEINSINLIYEDELKIKSATLNGNKIDIILEGEQTKYKEEAIDGSIIIVNANLSTSKKTPSSSEKIKVNYKNNNIVNSNEGITEKDIDIVSYAGIVTETQVPEYGIDVINNDGTKVGKLAISDETKIANVKHEIINNAGNKVRQVKILGTLPTKNAIKDINNIETSVNENLKLEGIDSSRAKVYYSNNENATAEVENNENNWEENIDNGNSKKYLVVIDELDNYEEVDFGYNFSVPEGLEYNQNTEFGYKVFYTNVETNVESVVEVENTKLETGKGPVVDTNLKAYTGTEETQNVKEGEILTYAMTVTNTGSEETENIKVTGKIPENTVYVENKTMEYTMTNEEKAFEPFEQDSEKQEVEFNIEKLGVGESTTRIYKVKVAENSSGEIVSNVATTVYGEVSKESNKVTNNIENADIDVELYSTEENNTIISNGYTIRYNVKVKNISNKEQNNLKLEISQNDIVEIEEIFYELNEDYVTETEKNYIDIQSLKVGQEIEVCVVLKAKVIKDGNTQTEMVSAKVIQDNKVYNSNAEQITVIPVNLKTNISSKNSDTYVKEGDILEYTISLKNNGTAKLEQVNVENKLSNATTLTAITKNGKELSEEEYTAKNEITGENTIKLSNELNKDEQTEYTIQAVVNEIPGNTTSIEILNSVKVYSDGVELESQEIKHILSPVKEAIDNENGNNSGNDNNGQEENNGNNSNGANNNQSNTGNTKSISGTVWIDDNANGLKDSSEQVVNDITVRLLNTRTNTFVKETKTNQSGFYSFDYIAQGEYLVVFEYDTSKYILTSYEKEGLDSRNTSKAINKEMTIDGNNKTVGVTEIIKLANDNISNINMGLQTAKNADLKIDKYISKVVIQNAKGTATKEYDNATFAKAEIDAKQMSNTTAVVEYIIKVTNNGEVDSYAKKVTDYISKDYKFNSELNKDWYQSGDNLQNTSLANEKIKPGESKELKLVVVKQMTESNTGLITNNAEITEKYNEYGLNDNQENDKASADLILSIKTGQIATTVVLVLVIIIALGSTAYIVSKYVFRKLI